MNSLQNATSYVGEGGCNELAGGCNHELPSHTLLDDMFN